MNFFLVNFRLESLEIHVWRGFLGIQIESRASIAFIYLFIPLRSGKTIASQMGQLPVK